MPCPGSSEDRLSNDWRMEWKMELTAEQRQHSLRRRVRLSERSDRRLLQHLSLGQIGSFLGDIRVTDARLGGREAGDLRLRELNRVLQLVLAGTDLALHNAELRYRRRDRARERKCVGRRIGGIGLSVALRFALAATPPRPPAPASAPRVSVKSVELSNFTSFPMRITSIPVPERPVRSLLNTASTEVSVVVSRVTTVAEPPEGVNVSVWFAPVAALTVPPT